MSTILIISILALALLLMISGFISSAETCLLSLDSTQILRIREHKPSAATQIEHLLSDTTRLLSTLLITNTVVNVSAAGIGFLIATMLVPAHAREWAAILGVTSLTLIFGEIAPKRLALLHAERMAVAYAPILLALQKGLAPAYPLMKRLVGSLDQSFTSKALSEEEYRAVMETGEQEGILDEEEREMVDGIIRLEDISAADVMTPRVDMIALNIDDPVSKHTEIVRRVRFKYLPVYKDDRDHINSFLHVPSYVMSSDRILDDHLTPVYTVPENAPISKVLTSFQKDRQHYAVVIDEHGGTAGVITLGDILEEIVDDVEGEHDRDKMTIESLGPNRWLINGSTSLEDVNYELETTLSAEGADRIAGWVTAHTGHVARVGERVEAQGCRVTVRQVRRHRITTVVLQKRSLPGLEN